jgi:hypothetical protein
MERWMDGLRKSVTFRKYLRMGSTNGRQPNIVWAEFFNSKLGSSFLFYSECIGCIQPLLAGNSY